MKNIFIFGNEYSSSDTSTWATTLGVAYGYSVQNHSVDGSSLHYTINKIIDCVNEGQISESDTIVVSVSSCKRSPIISETLMNPRFAIHYSPELLVIDANESRPSIRTTDILKRKGLLELQHYREFFDYYKGYYMNYGIRQIIAERFYMLNFLKNLPNKVILLRENDNILFDWTHRTLTQQDTDDIHAATVRLFGDADENFVLTNVVFNDNFRNICTKTATSKQQYDQENNSLASIVAQLISKK